MALVPKSLEHGSGPGSWRGGGGGVGALGGVLLECGEDGIQSFHMHSIVHL